MATPQIFMSKKRRAKMRTRRKRSIKDDSDKKDISGLPGSTTSESSPTHSATAENESSSLLTTTVIIPDEIIGAAVRKFRKDQRRAAKKKGEDPSSLIFVGGGGGGDNDENIVTNRDAGDGTKKRKRKGQKGDNKDGDDDDAGENSVEEEKKKKKKWIFPRINDVLLAAEAAAKQTPDGGPTTSSSSSLGPPIPQSERERYVAVDCEMVGIGENGSTSVLARVSIVDYDLKVLLDVHASVPCPVTDFRTHVSGVRPGDIDPRRNPDALDPAVVREKVCAILNKKILIGHSLRNDLGALMIDHPKRERRDTAEYKPLMRASGRGGGKMRPKKLRDLVWERVGRRIQVEGDEHDSVDDASASMELFRTVRVAWEAEIRKKDGTGKGGGRKG